MAGGWMGYLLSGAAFGFALSLAGASEYDLIYGMFTGRDLTLAYLMAFAIAVGALGMRVLRARGNRTVDGRVIAVKQRPLTAMTALGGAIFGLGWGLTGACPGTVLAQLGEGKLLGLFTVAGLIVGTYVYALLVERYPQLKA
jgi:uncharacterized membrane protein YedE/YeeE